MGIGTLRRYHDGASKGPSKGTTTMAKLAPTAEVGFASPAAEEAAEKLGVKPADLGEPSGKTGHTVADVKAAAEVEAPKVVKAKPKAKPKKKAAKGKAKG